MYMLPFKSTVGCFKGVVVYFFCVCLFLVLFGFFKGWSRLFCLWQRGNPAREFWSCICESPVPATSIFDEYNVSKVLCKMCGSGVHQRRAVIDFLTPDPYPKNFWISIFNPYPKISEISYPIFIRIQMRRWVHQWTLVFEILFIHRLYHDNSPWQVCSRQRWADCEIFQSESSPDPIKLNPIQSWSAKFWKSPVQSSLDPPM